MQDFCYTGIKVSRSVSVGMELTLLSSPLVMASGGGVLSPILFTDYVDSLLCESGCGCYWHNIFAGVLCYADLKIFAPSADGLRKMLEVCEEFVCSHHIRFNPAKTQLIRVLKTHFFQSYHLSFYGGSLLCLS